MKSAKDILNAEKLLFPGVGSYGQAMEVIQRRGYVDALKEHIAVRLYLTRRQQSREQAHRAATSQLGYWRLNRSGAAARVLRSADPPPSSCTRVVPQYKTGPVTDLSPLP